jgi:hypothetical protein
MRTRDVALYSALRKDLGVCIDLGSLSWGPESSPRDVACFSLLSSVLKKFCPDDKVPPDLYDTAWNDFKQDSERCGNWTLNLNTSVDEVLWGGLKHHLHKFFDMSTRDSPEIVYDYGEIFRRGRTGSGRSVLARDTDFFTKIFDSKVGTSPRLAPIWELLIQRNQLGNLFAEAERKRSARWGPPTVVEASSFSCVPKNVREARGVSTEPAGSMWMQLGLGSMIEARLNSYFGIDIRGDDLSNQQVKQRQLARLGSAHGTYCTVDLKKASNCIALRMIEDCCPRQIVEVMSVLRSPYTRNSKPTLVGGKKCHELVKLGMLSTMGNGFTFPLMTALLACAVYSVYDSLHDHCSLTGPTSRSSDKTPISARTGRTRRQHFGVFGDDIIVIPEAIPRLYRLLSLMGFIVNEEKSFIDGPFRESCGADFFAGYNVRGVYVKTLSTRESLFIAVNALARWSATHGVCLDETIRYLVSELTSKDGHSIRISSLAVPLHENDDAGLAIPFSLLYDSKCRRDGLMTYRRSEPQRWDYIISGGYCWHRRGQKVRNHNPEGVIITYLTGNCRDGFVSLRSNKVRYRRRRCHTPVWDYVTPSKLGLGQSFSIKQLAAVWSTLLIEEEISIPN